MELFYQLFLFIPDYRIIQRPMLCTIKAFFKHSFALHANLLFQERGIRGYLDEVYLVHDYLFHGHAKFQKHQRHLHLSHLSHSASHILLVATKPHGLVIDTLHTEAAQDMTLKRLIE